MAIDDETMRKAYTLDDIELKAIYDSILANLSPSKSPNMSAATSSVASDDESDEEEMICETDNFPKVNEAAEFTLDPDTEKDLWEATASAITHIVLKYPDIDEDDLIQLTAKKLLKAPFLDKNEEVQYDPQDDDELEHGDIPNTSATSHAHAPSVSPQ